MTTCYDIVARSLRTIGVLAAGETPSAEDAQDTLETLNDMIDSWRIESLMIYANEFNVFDLVAGQETYTIGTGGDFNIPRPDLFITAKSRVPNQTDLPLTILTQEQYAAIILKSTTSTISGAIVIDGAFPLRNITMWPVPQNDTQQLLLLTGTVLNGFADLSETVNLPPGYNRALIYNLAVEVAPMFGRPIPPQVAVIAVESKLNVQRENYVPRTLAYDPRLINRRDTWYNIFTDGNIV